MEDVGWRISLLQDTVDGVTNKPTRRPPGVFCNELNPSVAPVMKSEAFVISSVETTPVPLQLIFSGQQMPIQSRPTIARYNRAEQRKAREDPQLGLKSLESLCEIPARIRRLNYLRKRQLYRLLDLRDGGSTHTNICVFELHTKEKFERLGRRALTPLVRVFFVEKHSILRTSGA